MALVVASKLIGLDLLNKALNSYFNLSELLKIVTSNK